ncbi:MAG: substrate-binding domain-containing protein [Lachnospiraceae bacterium]|nr:substrate-binding domain-containing protein [Lachnospiraceae bacterium]MDD7628630.1 substrate-binding domain-containing protein [Lachnospiraceae bacterium]MDY4120156.1 substrate-binding domain-containing protein [Lachnospiraceae bacterium]
MAKAVKLADIAKIMNVSTVTVSKALSDQKGVSEEMREKIKHLADEMGYKSPSAAKMMSAKKSYNIGVVLSERFLDQYESFYWQMYQAVATKAVSKECFTMLEVLGIDTEQSLELPKLLKEHKVEGLIILGLLKEDYLNMLVQNVDVPFICLDFYDKHQECDAVVTDNFYGMYRLTNYLFEMGHQDIAYVGTLLYTESITDRYFGYAKAMLEHGRQIRPDWIIDDRNMDNGQRDDDFEFALPEKMPTAFVCNCDLTAGILINSLQKKGYRVPEDISVAGFDNYIHPGICKVGITTYEVDIKEMARKTINNLIKKMNHESYKQGISIVEGHMVIKDSVAKRS